MNAPYDGLCRDCPVALFYLPMLFQRASVSLVLQGERRGFVQSPTRLHERGSFAIASAACGGSVGAGGQWWSGNGTALAFSNGARPASEAKRSGPRGSGGKVMPEKERRPLTLEELESEEALELPDRVEMSI